MQLSYVCLFVDVCFEDNESRASRDSDPFFEFHHFDDEDFQVTLHLHCVGFDVETVLNVI